MTTKQEEEQRFLGLATDGAIRIALLAALLAACLTIMWPFLILVIWGIIIAIALYPLFRKLSSALGGRPRVTAVLMTLVALALLLVPTWIFLDSVTEGLFAALLPVGLVPHLGWITVPVAFLVSLVFLMIETMSRYLQDPFENKVTDTPMNALCRTIEINLRQLLGETDLPEKLEPVDGVLM